MQLTLMEESRNDFSEISDLIKLASKKQPLPFHNAHDVINTSRKSAAYIPRLSIVAKHEEAVVGHIALMKTSVRQTACDKTCLVMVSNYVLPALQNNGIGKALMRSIHMRAKGLDYRCIVVIGDGSYFERYGYTVSDDLTVLVPPDGLSLQPLVKELIPGSLMSMTGVVDLPKEYSFSSEKAHLL